MQGAEYAEEQRQPKGADIGQAAQKQGVLVHGADDGGDGLFVLKGNAPIPLQGILQPDAVLLIDGLVQAETVDGVRALLRAHALHAVAVIGAQRVAGR